MFAELTSWRPSSYIHSGRKKAWWFPVGIRYFAPDLTKNLRITPGSALTTKRHRPNSIIQPASEIFQPLASGLPTHTSMHAVSASVCWCRSCLGTGLRCSTTALVYGELLILAIAGSATPDTRGYSLTAAAWYTGVSCNRLACFQQRSTWM